MGHTIYPMRWVVYDKMGGMKRFVRGLREPERGIAEELLDHVFQNISTISYANPLPNEVENNMIFSMLLQMKKEGEEVDDLTLLLFSLMITYRKNKSKNPNESNIHRLLCSK